MQHYQTLTYRHYYVQDVTGQFHPATKQECFARAEKPTEDNPYKQRWFYDPEASYVIRLARTKEGDALGRRNAADLKAQTRQNDSDAENGLESLDARLDVGGELPIANASDVAELAADRIILAKLLEALDSLDHQILKLLKVGMSEKKIGEQIGLSQMGVNKRKWQMIRLFEEYL